MNVKSYGPGIAPSITHDGRFWRLAIGERPGVDVLLLNPDGAVVDTIRYAKGYGFPSIFGKNVIYKGNAETNWTAILNGDHVYDQAGGNWPVVAGHGWAAWQRPNDYAIARVRIDQPDATPEPVGFGAPDGLAWINPDGSVALIKDVRFHIPGLLNPQKAGDFWVGEQPDLDQTHRQNWPLGIAVSTSAQSFRGWIDGGTCFTPKIAVAPNGTDYAICTWGGPEVRVWFATVGELLALPAPPSVTTPTPPDPPSTPIPEPVTMKLPEAVKAIRTRYVAAFPVPQGEPGDAHEDRCRQWTLRFIAQVVFELPGQGWGSKRAAGPPSKDSIARQGLPLLSWDLLAGTGTGHPELIADPDSNDITGQTFVPVEGFNHLGSTPDPPHEPPPTPPNPDIDRRLQELKDGLESLAGKVSGFAEALARLDGRLTNVEATPMPNISKLRVKGNTGKTAYHQHEINLIVEIVP